MPICDPMGIICRTSVGTGSGAPDNRIFVQCINVRDPMANDLWSRGLDSIRRDVHPTARVEIPPGTD